MIIKITNMQIDITKNQDKAILDAIISKGIDKNSIVNIEYLKKSIDSRKINNIKFIYNLEVKLNKKIDIEKMKDVSLIKDKIDQKRVSNNTKGTIAIIGTGPAGLFAALRLAQYGYKPLIFERGETIDKRDKSVLKFEQLGILNPNSNIQFGEGGAGTYSDGKLTTRVKSGYINEVFEVLHKFGAQDEILYSYKPHIGTDILKNVIINIRNYIKELGGEFYFDSCLTDIKINNSVIKEITINENQKYDVDHLILGIGHSSRDTYYMLQKHGVHMENKDFAIGARIEHPRIDIDKMQYGKFAEHENLEAATYNFTYNNRNEQRGVFSFCMCPGGEIVNASSVDNGTLVNGMSYSTRDGEFSNSAIVVAIKKSDYGNNLFDGLKFQEKIEQKALQMIDGKGAISQTVYDYLNKKETNHKIRSSYKMDLYNKDLNKLFPEVINKNLHSALNYWRKNNLFISKNANLIGPETRTSAPVRIVRDSRGKSTNINNLYPIGEGAGYAGGIISAAIDGYKIVDNNFAKTL